MSSFWLFIFGGELDPCWVFFPGAPFWLIRLVAGIIWLYSFQEFAFRYGRRFARFGLFVVCIRGGSPVL